MNPNASGTIVFDGPQVIHEDRIGDIASALGTATAARTARMVPFAGPAAAGDEAILAALQIDTARSFVVGHEYQWARSFVIGEQVRCVLSVGDLWERGSNCFGEVLCQFTDRDGELVHLQRSTFLELAAPPHRGSAATRAQGDLPPGDPSLFPIGPITRVQMSRYAGATRDFNPIHIDEPYATGPAGMPAVAASGGMILTLALDHLLASRAIERVHKFGGRLTHPVFPGDCLSVTSSSEGQFTVTKHDGTVAVEGVYESVPAAILGAP